VPAGNFAGILWTRRDRPIRMQFLRPLVPVGSSERPQIPRAGRGQGGNFDIHTRVYLHFLRYSRSNAGKALLSLLLQPTLHKRVEQHDFINP